MHGYLQHYMYPRSLGRCGCLDHHELNKQAIKDALGEDSLTGAAIWEQAASPWGPQDREKTAFSPDIGMGAYEFTHMPFGLFGAHSSFLRYTIMRGLLFVPTYLDDVLPNPYMLEHAMKKSTTLNEES